MTDEANTTLQIRRQEILQASLERMRLRRRVRVSGNIAAALACAVGVALLGVHSASDPAPVPSAGVARVPEMAEVKTVTVARIELIENDESAIDRLSAPNVASRIELIDDATLVATLAPTCGSIGLAEFGGRTYVLGDCPQLGLTRRTP